MEAKKKSWFNSNRHIHYHYSLLMPSLAIDDMRDAVCTRELLRWHTMPTESSEASVCVLFVSLCVIPIAIWAHSVPLCRLISPFLKSQAPLLSSSGFRRLPLSLTLGWNMNVSVSFCSFMKQLLLKISLQQCIIITIDLRKSPQNSAVSWNDDLLLKKCDATLRGKKKEGRSQTFMSTCPSLIWASPALCHMLGHVTHIGGCFCTSYTCTRPRF